MRIPCRYLPIFLFLHSAPKTTLFIQNIKTRDSTAQTPTKIPYFSTYMTRMFVYEPQNNKEDDLRFASVPL